MKRKVVIIGLIFLSFGCYKIPPNTFVKTFDEPGMWKSIEVRENISKDELWRTVVDALSQRYDIEVLDKESGYLRTSWRYTYIWRGAVSEDYRSRIIVKFLGDKWAVCQVKCESNWLDTYGWIVGYDSRLLEDVYGDLQGRIGRIRR